MVASVAHICKTKGVGHSFVYDQRQFTDRLGAQASEEIGTYVHDCLCRESLLTANTYDVGSGERFPSSILYTPA
jgi:hypothetical protein